jgi:hypothetical protein
MTASMDYARRTSGPAAIAAGPFVHFVGGRFRVFPTRRIIS